MLTICAACQNNLASINQDGEKKMCRLIAVTSEEPLSPMVAIEALNVMKEGHDGSGVGLFLRDLGGPFEDIKDAPILSGIFSEGGLRRLDAFMMDIGFMTKYKLTIKVPKQPPPETPKRDIYLVRAYEYPEEWEELGQDVLYDKLVEIRLTLRKMGEEKQDMIVFSFWPDVIMIKEIGDPIKVAQYLKLDREDLRARVIMAQGRQNTNYAITLYACHPFFVQGYSTMTNGENTAFIPIKEFLLSRGFPGYMGYQSDSEVFTHILHYTYTNLGMGIEAYKHVITPLQDNNIAHHPDAHILKHMKNTCRKLTIDGPNCIIGCLPDHSLFMAQDRKKLRPGVVGGRPGLYAFSSEICGLDAAIPTRDKDKDFQPMYLDTAIVGPDRQEVRICSQTEPLHLLH
jgi:predicted glutamine amidotransferase